MKELELKDLDAAADWWERESEGKRTEWVRFENNTHVFEVEVFLFEFRQVEHLPPPNGFVAYTGVTVGATDIAPGERRTHNLQQKVLGQKADAGLLNVRNRRTGTVHRTFNFPDRQAPSGRFYRSQIWGIRQTNKLAEGADIELTFEGILDDGTIVRE